MKMQECIMCIVVLLVEVNLSVRIRVGVVSSVSVLKLKKLGYERCRSVL